MVDNGVFDPDERSRAAHVERQPDSAPSHADLHEPDVQRSAQGSSASGRAQGDKEGDASSLPGSLLANRHLASRGNEPVRIAILQQMQESHGNRAVQRFLNVQRQAPSSPAGSAQSEKSLGDKIQSAQGQGSGLDHGTQERLEEGLGADLSGVRVHTGSDADHMAKSVDAVAFTTGQDIFFREGTYNPGTQEGMKLLAHEATHTVQQSRGPVAGTPTQEGDVSISDPSDSFEQAAEVTASRIATTNTSPTQRKADDSNSLSGASGSLQRSTDDLRVQRFGSKEHQSLGNQATGTADVNLGGEKGYERFELHHGDVVALSGDYFLTSKDEYPPSVPYNNDDLFTLAKIPGAVTGPVTGTSDEIICALYEINPKDARFQKGGIWELYVSDFDGSDNVTDGGRLGKHVKAAVDDRYQRLAAVNATHFTAPRGRDAAGNPLPSPEGSAGGSYRSLHERAIKMAFEAGSKKSELSHPMAMEAAAQHYLTDAFSAGHLLTERANLQEYWGNKYPLFWYNLIHKIALDTAIEVNDQDTNISTIWATVQDIYESVLKDAEKMAGGLPPITIGDLVSLVFHDYNDEAGVRIQGGGMVYGDSNLDNPNPANRTRDLAVAAIKAGNKDVDVAFDLGQSGRVMADPDLFSEVRIRTTPADSTLAPPGPYAVPTPDKYVAETMIPKPAADSPKQNWKADSIEALWDKPVVDGAPVTVGALISKTLQPGEDIGDKLIGLANSFPEVDDHLTGNVHPRKGYINGFLKPVLADPKAAILAIINWAPNYGLRDSDRDDVSLDTGEDLDKKGMLKGMTTEARIGYVSELIGGSVARDEEELVVRIFETAPAHDRPEMYRQVEGHVWTGDWIEGYFTDDDELYNALSGSRLDRVKELINEGASSK